MSRTAFWTSEKDAFIRRYWESHLGGLEDRLRARHVLFPMPGEAARVIDAAVVCAVLLNQQEVGRQVAELANALVTSPHAKLPVGQTSGFRRTVSSGSGVIFQWGMQSFLNCFTRDCIMAQANQQFGELTPQQVNERDDEILARFPAWSVGLEDLL